RETSLFSVERAVLDQRGDLVHEVTPVERHRNVLGPPEIGEVRNERDQILGLMIVGGDLQRTRSERAELLLELFRIEQAVHRGERVALRTQERGELAKIDRV